MLIYGGRVNCLEYILSATELLQYQDVPKFGGLCRDCPHFSTNFSCPPVPFSPREAILSHSVAHIFINKADDPSRRESLKISTDIELKHRFPIVFSAGKCNKCTSCKRQSNGSCSDFLYSAEVLCLDMCKLYHDLTGTPLLFDGTTLIHIAFEHRQPS